MAYNYRCSKPGCRTRRTIAHPYEWYIRVPKCRGCKQDTLRFDGAVRRQTLRRTCYCREIYFPHRRGTMSPSWGICEHVPPDIAEKFYERYIRP